MDIGELSEWMLGQSYGVNRPRSQIVHLSIDDRRLLCTRELDGSDYECVGTVLPADMVEPIVHIECGMYVSYYRYCKQCVKALRKIGARGERRRYDLFDTEDASRDALGREHND